MPERASLLARKAKGLQADGLTGIVSAHLDQGLNAEALEPAQLAVALYEEAEDAGGLSVALALQGNVLLALGRHAEARESALRSLAIHSDGRVSALILLGSLSISAGDFRQAIYWYAEGLEAAKISGDRVGEAEALGGLAQAYGELGDREHSAQYLESRIALNRSG